MKVTRNTTSIGKGSPVKELKRKRNNRKKAHPVVANRKMAIRNRLRQRKKQLHQCNNKEKTHGFGGNSNPIALNDSKRTMKPTETRTIKRSKERSSTSIQKIPKNTITTMKTFVHPKKSSRKRSCFNPNRVEEVKENDSNNIEQKESIELMNTPRWRVLLTDIARGKGLHDKKLSGNQISKLLLNGQRKTTSVALAGKLNVSLNGKLQVALKGKLNVSLVGNLDLKLDKLQIENIQKV